jgi:hypothetical protein
MKKILLLFSFVLLISSLYGQEIEISGIIANSGAKKFKNSFGYTLGYNQIGIKNKFGISFSQYSYVTTYDDIHNPMYAPSSLSITETDPNNKRYALKLNYAFGLVNYSKSKLYLGPEIGLNYFRIKEQTERIANGDIAALNYASNYTVNNRLGIGFLLEFQLNEVISKRISTVLSVNPEITSFEKFLVAGSADPNFIGWLNFKLGIRYKLKKE